MSNIVSLALLVAAAGLFAWRARRACQISSVLLRWLTVTLTGLSALIATVMAVLFLTGLVRMSTRSAPLRQLQVAGTPEQLQRGAAIAASFCGSCHSRTAPLTGDFDVGSKLPISVGTFVAANLTPTGRLGAWSDAEVFRAIRNSVDADGHWLMIMSYTNASRLSDSDIQAVIAYLRSRPAAGRPTATPPDRLNFLGVLLLGAGLLPQGQPVVTAAIAAPRKSSTAQYGEYILRYSDCRACHGADLRGGVAGQLGPIGPDLRLVSRWTAPEFINTLRTGVDPGGHQLREDMPWREIGRMDDEELTAVYNTLRELGTLQR
jgi:mono/diheme cytochrome c family protein